MDVAASILVLVLCPSPDGNSNNFSAAAAREFGNIPILAVGPQPPVYPRRHGRDLIGERSCGTLVRVVLVYTAVRHRAFSEIYDIANSNDAIDPSGVLPRLTRPGQSRHRLKPHVG